MISIPLRYRLPNPSPELDVVAQFRTSVHQKLADALATERLVLVVGEDDAATSDLSVRTLHKYLPEQRDSMLYVELEGSSLLEQLLVKLLSGLAKSLGERRVDWKRHFVDLDAAIAMAIDVVDEHNLRVVVDGIDWTHFEEIEDLFSAISRYSRQGKWLFIGSGLAAFDTPATRRSAFYVDTMDQDEMVEIARALEPEIDQPRLAETLAKCDGNPALLPRLLARSERFDRFEDCTEDQVELLDLLAVIRHPVAANDFEVVITARDVAGLRDELTDSALIEPVDGGWRLVPGIRQAWKEFRDPTLLKNQRAKFMERVDPRQGLAMLVEKVDFLLDHRRFEEARKLLENRGSHLLNAGYAATMWKSLQNIETDQLERWRLVIGIHAGQRDFDADLDAVAADWLQFDPTVDAELFRSRMSIFFLANRLQDVIGLSRRFLDHWEANLDDGLEMRRQLFPVRFIYTSALTYTGHLDDALQQAQRFPDKTPEERITRDLRIANILAAQSNRDDSLALCRKVWSTWTELDQQARRPADAYELVRAFAINNSMLEAREALTGVIAELGSGASVIHHGRSLLILQGVIAVETGDLAMCSALSERLQLHTANTELTRHLVDAIELERRLLAGELDGLAEELQEYYHRALALENGDNLYEARCKLLRLQILQGTQPQDPIPLEISPHETSYEQLVDVHHYHQSIRHEHPVEAAIDPDQWKGRARIPGLVAMGQQAAMEGDQLRASRCIRRAIEKTEDRGLYAQRTLAIFRWCENLLVLDSPELGDAARQLHTAAEEMGSPHLMQEARFFELIADEAGEPAHCPAIYASFEAIATAPVVAPTAARRCAALLGDDVARDALDERLLEIVCTRLQWKQPQLITCRTANNERPSWGIHRQSHTVWFGDGDTVSLEDHKVLWKVLECIVHNGGYVEKEPLIVEVWEVDEYHPLHHDNRLRLAISKLRKKLRAPGRDRPFLSFADDGYGLDGPVRLVDIRAS